MTELLGQRLGDYQLEALLTTGAIGTLYRARHVRLERVAMVQLFASGLLQRPALQPRLLAALRGVAALRHPHIAAIFDVAEQDGQLFVVSDLPAGGTLRSLDAATPLATRLELLAQAAEGLAYAHAAGIIHGALRPELLLLDEMRPAQPLQLKLSELGISSLLPELALEAPAYLAPEQCRGLALDGRTDIYSLGIVLYEQLVGAPPFEAENLEAAIGQHLEARPVPPREVQPNIAPELERIVLRCLAKAPADRFADANELAVALRQAAAHATSAPQAQTGKHARVGANKPAPQIAILDQQGAQLRSADMAAGTLTLGRTPENDLCLDDPLVAAQHLRLVWDGQQVTVSDLGASSGTFLGGARIPPGIAIPWDGRIPLRAGPFTLRIVGTQAAEVPAPMAQAAPPEPPATLDDPFLASLLTPLGTPVVTPPPPVPPRARLEVQCDQDRALLNPGSPTVVPVRLINSGQTSIEATLRIEGEASAWVRKADLPVVRLEPGAQSNSSLLVNVPRDANVAAGDYPVTLHAQALGAPAETGSARMQWTVAAYADLDVRLLPPSNQSHGVADYQVLLHNAGNAPLTALLNFEDDGSLGFTLTQDEVPLAAGQSVRVGLNVEAAGRLFGHPQRRRFAIRAESDAGQSRLAEGELTHLARLPAWTPLAIFGVLVLLLIAGFANILLGGLDQSEASLPTPIIAMLPTNTATPFPTPLPGAPRVLEFRVEPELTAPGELVRVVWSVEGAERVQIDRFGDVEPIGARDFRPEQTTEFRMSAWGGGQETLAIIYVNVAPATPMPTEVPLVPTEVPPPPVEVPIVPTEVPPPPTEVPPLPTEVPPLPTEVPPLPTEVPPPPTEVPPLPPATEVPPPSEPATEEPAAPVALELSQLAARASWSTNSGRIGFGQPFFFAGRGGWAEIVNTPLEDGQAFRELLQMVPPNAVPRNAAEQRPFIQGEFVLPTLVPGQHFAADIGFGQGISSEPISITVRLNDSVMLEVSKAPDGTLLPIWIDLSPFAGQEGRLTLHISAPATSTPPGIFWVRPRVE
ncbi:MAG: FHA domain-containing protein [Candidatus Viridilinea halotolerans]|uniref:non-specific serine/threonine protein kinase n=1 Tax=Candidatus Viridilinea halotolerans TaxID=2491704 RepID=A0A426U9T9_9CHLR|nr:MAG: FHA domain-containing protein [Candidatus Viridilinea halotolerans]